MPLFLENLPDELLLRIIRYLAAPDLCRLAQTAKKWERLAQDDELWKSRVTKELTETPYLVPGQTYKEYYKLFYQDKEIQGSIIFPMHSDSKYSKYLRNKLWGKSISFEEHNYVATAISGKAELWLKELLLSGAGVSYFDFTKVVEKGNEVLTSLLIPYVSDEELNLAQSSSKWEGQPLCYEDAQTGIEIIDPPLLSLFHVAALSSNPTATLKCLFTQPDRITILPEIHKAAALGDMGKVSSLIGQGVSIDASDGMGCTPLWWALVNQQTPCALMLIRDNATIDIIGRDKDETALMTCIRHKNRECLQAILQRGLSLEEETYEEEMSLHEGIEERHYKIKINALHKAVEFNFLPAVELLVQSGMKIDDPRYSFSPLHMAAQKGSLQCLNYLIQTHPALINSQGYRRDEDDKYREDMYSSPLYLAIEHCHYDCARLLLLAGANPEVGRTITRYCRGKTNGAKEQPVLQEFTGFFNARKNVELQRELCHAEWTLNSEQFPITKQIIALLKLMFEKGASPNTPCGLSINTLLINLLIKCYFKYINQAAHFKVNYAQFLAACIELFIDFKVDVNAEQAIYGSTALHHAAENHPISIMRLLVERGGAIVSAQDKEGNTPLHRAARSGNKETIEYLLSQGASVGEANQKGETLATLLVRYKHIKLRDTLFPNLAALEENENALVSRVR